MGIEARGHTMSYRHAGTTFAKDIILHHNGSDSVNQEVLLSFHLQIRVFTFLAVQVNGLASQEKGSNSINMSLRFD